ncbi:MAG: hypothetical protein AAF499_01865, partial [Pseudomonadota bacterium]
LHFDLLAADWPAIAVALVVSTAATVVVTGLIMRWLGRRDIGSLEVGKACDLVAWRTDTLHFAGYDADPVAALVFGNPGSVNHAVINGQPRVLDGELVGNDLDEVLRDHKREAQALINRSTISIH